jgi:hypothetical protein
VRDLVHERRMACAAVWLWPMTCGPGSLMRQHKRHVQTKFGTLEVTHVPIRTLDHVNIRTDKLAATWEFYGELLSLTVTTTPGSSDLTKGAWLCVALQRPVVRLATNAGRYGDGKGGARAGKGSGAVHHVAFECTGCDSSFPNLTAFW